MISQQPDSQMRARVARLLSGDFRNDDLTRLFLFARDRCEGRESVQEIGDFVAHHSERTKGIVTRAARDWFITVQFFLRLRAGQITEDRLPRNFYAVLEASLRSERSVIRGQDLQMKRVEAQRRLSEIKTRFSENPDGTLLVRGGLTGADASLIRHLSGRFNNKAAFDHDRLYSDFLETLRRNSILKTEEMTAFLQYRTAIALFAISVMHNCTIRIDETQTTVLHISAFAGKLAVAAPVTVPDNDNVRVAYPIFRTELDHSAHCEPELLNLDAVIQQDIEINPASGRLGILR